MAGNDWLRACVADNLMQLVVLHLEGGPPAETLGITAQAWLRVMAGWPIAWDEKLDRARIDAGFLLLAGQSQRWPSPSQLRALLPARAYPDPALDAPDYPKEKAAANRRKIKQLITYAFEMKELKSKLAYAQSDYRMTVTEKAEIIKTLKDDIAKLQQRIDEVGQP
jgi:hypothetical protein